MSVSSGFTRRRFLRVSAQAATFSLLPPALRKALAEGTSQPQSPQKIEHVVLMMQENRSFDHYFGTLSGVRGFSDPDALMLSTGRSVFYQPDIKNPDGFILPFRLDTKNTSAQKIPSTSHAWDVQHAAWNGGAMDNWISAHRKSDGDNAPYVMGYYSRDDIPFHYALADAFTICDAYHSSVLGPTHPNRFYWMTGTIDPDGQAGGPATTNFEDLGKPQGLGWTTYAERLEKAGISWKVYQEADNFGCNVLEYFTTFRKASPNSSLYLKGCARGTTDQFERDAVNDQLPAVSWIIPTSNACEHPDSMPASGAAFIASKLEAIATNPKVWAKTAVILSYDENDGLFDHVPPPVPPLGTAEEFVGGKPIGGGFRVPCIVISPWTTGGWVCSENFDHTSVLQFLEKFTGVREPNISNWRRQTFGDLTAAFRFDDPTTNRPDLPDALELLGEANDEVKNFPAPTVPAQRQCLPLQEPGSRPRISG